MKDIKVEYKDPISILCVNISDINILKNPIMHSKTRNIPIKYHFLREQVTKQIANLDVISPFTSMPSRDEETKAFIFI